MASQCVQCKVFVEGDTWEPGQVCLFGLLFACSVECARTWASQNVAHGFRPGEPGYREEIEPKAPP